MNILVIPEEDEHVALKRFLNLSRVFYNNDCKIINNKEYRMSPTSGTVYLTYKDNMGDYVFWEIMIPISWYSDSKHYVVTELSDDEFVIEFHEFIEDYSES